MRTPYYATLPREKIGREIIARVQRYYADTRVTEILAKQRVAYRYYLDLSLNWAGWGTPGTTNQMQRGGDEGELALIRINHCRNLVGNKIAMVANAKFDARPRAESDDYDSMHATELCGYALDHYKQAAKLEMRRIERLAGASTMGVGCTYYGWNPSKGRPFARNPDTGRIEYTGDVEAKTVLAWDMIQNPYRNWDDQVDLTLRFPEEDKYILAARYPDFADQILDAPSQTVVPFFTPTSAAQSNAAPNGTELFIWFHLPCEVQPMEADGVGLEEGRMCLVLGTGHVIDDQPLAIRRFPVSRVSEAPDVPGSPFGYPSFWEYLGIQELYDNLQSVVATNQSTTGVQNIAVKTGVDPRPMQLEGGLNVWVCNDPEHDIVSKQLTHTAAEVFPHMQDLRKNMELLSGGSSVDRGEAQGDRQAASALALLSSVTIRNASPYQTSDAEALKDENQIILRLLRTHAKRPLTITVSERGQTTYERAIVGRDLGNVDAVDIELANPLQQTTEGRIAILQTFAQLKIPMRPEQAMEVVTSGRLEPVTDAATQEGLRIRLENKMILRGEVPKALLTDDAIRHCREHTITMSGPARDNPVAFNAYMQHIVGEHYRAFYGTEPEQDKLNGTYRAKLMVLCGLQPPPPDPMQQMQMAQGGAPAAGAPPELPPPGPADGAAANAGETPGAPPPGRLPKPPRNAATGERWTPTSGGGTPQ